MSNLSLPTEYRGNGCLPGIFACLCAIGCFLLGWMITFGPKELYLIVALIFCAIGLFVSIYFLIFPPIALRFSKDGFQAGKQALVRWKDISNFEIFPVANETELLGLKFNEQAKGSYGSQHASETPAVVKAKFDYTLNLMDFRCSHEDWGEFLKQNVRGTSSTVVSNDAAAQVHAPIETSQLGKQLTKLGPKRKRYFLELPGLMLTPLMLLGIVVPLAVLDKGDLRKIAVVLPLFAGLAVYGLFFWWYQIFTLKSRSVSVFENGIQGESKGSTFVASWSQVHSLTTVKQRIDQFGLIPMFTKYEITLSDGTSFHFSNLLNGKTQEVVKFIIKKAKLKPVPSALTQGEFFQKIPE